MSYKYNPPPTPPGYAGNDELYQQHLELGRKTDHLPTVRLEAEKRSKAKANRKAYTVYLVFILLLLTAGASISFNGWFWGLTILFFLVGLGGERIQSMGRTSSGTRVYIDHGAKKNTGGMAGACCFSLAYITSYTLLGFVVHLMGRQVVNLSPIDNYGLIFFMITFVTTLPIWYLLLRVFHSNTKAGWITLGIWLLILTIISRT